jgi:RHS repeat-associated protein
MGYDYRYNGIERNDELGLDLAPFRSYDPAIGRWLQVDPMADAMPNMTPYRFGFNNPLSFSDPSGLFEEKKRVPGEETTRELNGREIRIGYAEESSSSNSLGPAPDFSWLMNGGSGRGSNASRRCSTCPTYDLPTATVTAQAPSDYWRVNGELMHQTRVFELARANQLLAAMILQERYGTTAAIKFMQYDVNSAIYNFANSYVNPVLLSITPIPLYSSAFSRFLPFVKPMRVSGGKLDGFTISLGRGYGARRRIDFHTLRNASKKTSRFPSWVSGRRLFHYHRGRGNNLRRHRPWEIGAKDASFWSRF